MKTLRRAAGKKTTLILCLFEVAVISATLAAQEIPLAIGEWPPYTGSDLERRGMAVEIVAEAAKAAGLNLTVTFFPWRRAEAGVAEGKAFGTFPYQITEERKSAFLFSDVLFTSRFIVAYRQGALPEGSKAYRYPEDFTGKTVGVIAGTDAVYKPLLQAGIVAIEAQTPGQLAKMLAAGRIDFAIDDELVLLKAIQDDKIEGIAIQDVPFGNSAAFRMMVSRKYPDAETLLERFNGGLTTIRNNGVIEEILVRYAPDDAPGNF